MPTKNRNGYTRWIDEHRSIAQRKKTHASIVLWLGQCSIQWKINRKCSFRWRKRDFIQRSKNHSVGRMKLDANCAQIDYKPTKYVIIIRRKVLTLYIQKKKRSKEKWKKREKQETNRILRRPNEIFWHWRMHSIFHISVGKLSNIQQTWPKNFWSYSEFLEF